MTTLYIKKGVGKTGKPIKGEYDPATGKYIYFDRIGVGTGGHHRVLAPAAGARVAHGGGPINESSYVTTKNTSPRQPTKGSNLPPRRQLGRRKKSGRRTDTDSEKKLQDRDKKTKQSQKRAETEAHKKIARLVISTSPSANKTRARLKAALREERGTAKSLIIKASHPSRSYFKDIPIDESTTLKPKTLKDRQAEQKPSVKDSYSPKVEHVINRPTVKPVIKKEKLGVTTKGDVIHTNSPFSHGSDWSGEDHQRAYKLHRSEVEYHIHKYEQAKRDGLDVSDSASKAAYHNAASQYHVSKYTGNEEQIKNSHNRLRLMHQTAFSSHPGNVLGRTPRGFKVYHHSAISHPEEWDESDHLHAARLHTTDAAKSDDPKKEHLRMRSFAYHKSMADALRDQRTGNVDGANKNFRSAQHYSKQVKSQHEIAFPEENDESLHKSSLDDFFHKLDKEKGRSQDDWKKESHKKFLEISGERPKTAQKPNSKLNWVDSGKTSFADTNHGRYSIEHGSATGKHAINYWANRADGYRDAFGIDEYGNQLNYTDTFRHSTMDDAKRAAEIHHSNKISVRKSLRLYIVKSFRKLLGYTRNNKEVWSDSFNREHWGHGNWNTQDHRDAAGIHRAAASSIRLPREVQGKVERISSNWRSSPEQHTINYHHASSDHHELIAGYLETGRGLDEILDREPKLSELHDRSFGPKIIKSSLDDFFHKLDKEKGRGSDDWKKDVDARYKQAFNTGKTDFKGSQPKYLPSRILGTTRSGKEIWTHSPSSHQGWDIDDHHDAAKRHLYEARLTAFEPDPRKSDYHDSAAEYHSKVHDHLKYAEGHYPREMKDKLHKEHMEIYNTPHWKKSLFIEKSSLDDFFHKLDKEKGRKQDDWKKDIDARYKQAFNTGKTASSHPSLTTPTNAANRKHLSDEVYSDSPFTHIHDPNFDHEYAHKIHDTESVMQLMGGSDKRHKYHVAAANYHKDLHEALTGGTGKLAEITSRRSNLKKMHDEAYGTKLPPPWARKSLNMNKSFLFIRIEA